MKNRVTELIISSNDLRKAARAVKPTSRQTAVLELFSRLDDLFAECGAEELAELGSGTWGWDTEGSEVVRINFKENASTVLCCTYFNLKLDQLINKFEEGERKEVLALVKRLNMTDR